MRKLFVLYVYFKPIIEPSKGSVGLDAFAQIQPPTVMQMQINHDVER